MAGESTAADNAAPGAANWVANASHLWERRRVLLRATLVAAALGVLVAFTLPKEYESTARLMPPDSAGSSSAMLAALAGRSPGGIAGLASSLMGARSTSILFVELLRSRSISDHIIEHFDLQQVYHKRYRIDAVKALEKRTAISEDKKSGVVTLTVADTSAERAQQIAQAYLEELNRMVTRANTSSATRERQFIEQRLVSVQAELQDAQNALSRFSSANTTLDIKEQTRAMLDAAAKLQAEKIAGESELASLEQIYGDGNVRVRAARARIAGLQHELDAMSGGQGTDSYPSLRQLPKLAVPYANLYRNVRIQENVFDLLSQQHEAARIEEAKDIPIVSVIDAPLIAEKKSFPPRLLILVIFVVMALGGTSAFLLLQQTWQRVSSDDPRKQLAHRIATAARSLVRRRGGA